MLKSSLFGVIFEGKDVFNGEYLTPDCKDYTLITYDIGACQINGTLEMSICDQCNRNKLNYN